MHVTISRIVAFAGVWLFTQSAVPENVISPARTVRIAADAEEVYAEGRWRRDPEASTSLQPSLSATNSVIVTCSRVEDTCSEVIAVLVDDDESGRPPRLYPQMQRYAVFGWTETMVIASAETRAADLVLFLDFSQGVARRVLSETTARGAQTEDPRTEHWTLE